MILLKRLPAGRQGSAQIKSVFWFFIFKQLMRLGMGNYFFRTLTFQGGANTGG
jgi:hypothetical protein